MNQPKNSYEFSTYVLPKTMYTFCWDVLQKHSNDGWLIVGIVENGIYEGPYKGDYKPQNPEPALTYYFQRLK